MKETNTSYLLSSPYTKLFWNEYLLNPEGCEYNLVLDQDLFGNIDINKIGKTISILSKSYPLFTMNLNYNDGQLFWRPSSNKSSLEIINDINDISKKLNLPFNLESDNLVRYYLFKYADNHFRFFVVLHHVVIDGLSAQEFYDSISEIYNNIDNYEKCTNKNKELDNYQYTIGYDDIQKTFLDFNDSVNLLIDKHDSVSYWQNMLKNCPSKLDLPFIKNNETEQYESAEVRFKLNQHQWLKLKSGLKYANHFLVFKTL